MLMDGMLTLLLLTALGAVFLYQARICGGSNPNFFDVANTKAMRGLWCIIVVLVHIPVLYQNPVQDLAGSFAYIGVTFFFMTSAYGLSLQFRQNPHARRTFWKKRLIALLLPQLLSNLLMMGLTCLLCAETASLRSLFAINSWVRWLLCVYLIFWIASFLCRRFQMHSAMVALIISGISLASFLLKQNGNISGTVWSTEIWGVVWGILLIFTFPWLIKTSSHRWMLKCCGLCLVSVFLGVLYLKCKWIPFWGNYLLKILLGAAITLFLLHLNTKIAVGNKAIWFLGECSYEIYLIHGGVFSLFLRLFPHFSSGVFILLSVLCTIALAALVHRASRWIQKKWLRLS